MRLSKSCTIAAKDFKTYRRKKNIIYSLVVVPLIVAVLIPAVINYGGHNGGANGIPATELVILLPAFLFFFVILGAYLPTPIASYTIVGEKVEKSLEPLLATPTTDGEILLGKGIAAFIPPLIAVWGSATVFMILMDITTHATLGYYYFPNWDSAVLLFTLVPLAALLSVQVNVIVSSRMNDVRTSQQLGALTVLPLAGLYVAGELDIIDLGSTKTFFVIVAGFLVVDVLLFFVSRATFRREEILTRWR